MLFHTGLYNSLIPLSSIEFNTHIFLFYKIFIPVDTYFVTFFVLGLPGFM